LEEVGEPKTESTRKLKSAMALTTTTLMHMPALELAMPSVTVKRKSKPTRGPRSDSNLPSNYNSG
jgi:hypothetical protein